MIDGKRSCDDLAGLAEGLGDTDQLLGVLLDDGFIEAGSTGALLDTPATAPAAAPVTQGISLRDAQRFAARRLTDMLGPNAEHLCLRIEAARNAHDFRVAVKGAEGVVWDFRGSQAAQDFSTEISAHLPSP